MPCYLFTYHAYRSWMPDRKQGYVRRGEGVLPPDEERAQQYRERANEEEITFDSSIQLLAIDELQLAFTHQECRGHYIATEPTHIHALVRWPDERRWEQIRGGLKSSLTRCFNREVRRRTWFVRSASRRQVKDQAHFDYLVGEYLPSHGGWNGAKAASRFADRGNEVVAHASPLQRAKRVAIVESR